MWLLQALIHESELEAWLAGLPSPDSSCSGLLLTHNQTSPQHHNVPQQCPGSCLQQQNPGLRKLVLFSLNDYLGLSCHSDVCRAAAEAAQQVGFELEHPGTGCVMMGSGTVLVAKARVTGWEGYCDISVMALACQSCRVVSGCHSSTAVVINDSATPI